MNRTCNHPTFVYKGRRCYCKTCGDEIHDVL